MGMFDYLQCKEPLPLPGFEKRVFQTKSFPDPDLGYYLIRDGHLYRRDYRYSSVPKEKRPYYGKPEWNNEDVVGLLIRATGSVRRRSRGMLQFPFTGEVRFHDFRVEDEAGSGLVGFVALFKDGNLLSPVSLVAKEGISSNA
jgi:hypothetical protein